MRVRLGALVGLIVVVAAGCFTPYDIDGSGRTSLVWWDQASHQWQQHDPAHPGSPTVLATGTSPDSEGWMGDFDGDGRYDLGIIEPRLPWMDPAIRWPGGTTIVHWPAHSPASPWSGPCGGCTSTNAMVVLGAYLEPHTTVPAFYQAYDATWTIAGQSFTFGRPMHAGGLPDWDVPVPADYDGDGITDVAVYNPVSGDWTVRRDGQPVVIATLGGAGAFPLPADWDGDGRAEPAFITGSEIHALGQPTVTVPTGVFDAGIPIVGDYDGDGRMEPGALLHAATPRRWVTTVHDGAGADAPLTIGASVVMPQTATPGAFAGTMALTVDIARLTYLQQCAAHPGTC